MERHRQTKTELFGEKSDAEFFGLGLNVLKQKPQTASGKFLLISKFISRAITSFASEHFHVFQSQCSVHRRSS